MRATAMTLLACALVFPACDTNSIDASGSIVTETRDVSSFDEIDASQGIVVRLTVDSSIAASVTVHYDDNLVDHVLTDVNGDTLRLRLDAEVNSRQGADRFVDVVAADVATINVSNGAVLSGTGVAEHVELTASGGAVVELSNLAVGRLNVDLSGGAVARVTATDAVEGEASGGALLTLLGDPPTLDVATSGGALVTRQ